ncbi:MAG: class 1 fructose-bisphosphatase [Nitrospinaceae bacterium]|nr:class 1 fructose-bisphosphatase [Nitrospina sp.]MBT5375220.1 class 1 fructose-bisphosphatase [Nitrospinaceae bacterium]MBT5868521.1 class 1 fructose-bisphosphatase [Nitrospinaceae bacterium]MBT6346946.1 class 1 fructose-bisphosphatase [Nitrospina sp.]
MEQTTLVQHIRQQENNTPGATGEFTNLMNEIMVASKIISLEVNSAGIGEDIFGLTGKINIQGEEVKKLDEFSDITFTKLIGQSGTVCAITSEEKDEPLIIEDNPGKYIFMMDPLDGSSNIDVNVNIGTIFSIYKKKSPGSEVTDEDLLQKGDQQVAAGYIVYGSSTIFVYTSGEGVHGFTLDPALGEFFLSHPDIIIPSQGSTYSVNEGNWAAWDEPQKDLVAYLKEEDDSTGRPYKLRYIGSLVADFHRTLLKGGLFMYPRDRKSPKGKLRFSFEAAPLAFIVEKAGGNATTGNERILDITPTGIHDRLPLFIGSKNDVEMAETRLAAKVKKGSWFQWLSG